jgi:hypothetical protein
MNDLERKIDALAAQLDASRKKAVFSTKLTALVYGLLVVFVFAYTSFIVTHLKRAATPDNLSAVVKTTIQEMLPALRVNVVNSAKASAPQLADYLANLPKEVAPILEDRVKSLVDDQIDVVVTAVKTDLVPRLVEVLDANAEAIHLTTESLKDQSVASALSLLLVEELEVEMDKMFNDQFRRTCADLRDQLDQIREKPVDALTQKERVERQLLIGWVFLTEHGDAQSSYGNVLERLGHMYEFVFGAVQEKILEPESMAEEDEEACVSVEVEVE